jgi:glutathione S-transferase
MQNAAWSRQDRMDSGGEHLNQPITLWGAGTSRTFRPIWVAEELGIPYDLKPIGPRTGETLTAEYTRLNPKQKIPVLVDGSFRLSESVAICRYLIANHPRGNIAAPSTPAERAREDEWCCYIYGELDETSLYVMRRHGDLGHIYGRAPEVVASAANYASRHLQVIAAHMHDRSTVMPYGFGLADVLLMSCLDWAAAYGLDLPDVLAAYRAAIAGRAAYGRAVAANFKPAR